MVVHTFLWVVTDHCLCARSVKSHNFFVLRRILVQFHIRTRLIESFPTTYWLWWCAEEKWHFTPVHTLCQLKCDEGLFQPLPIGLADRNGLKNLPRQIFSACVKFGGNPCRNVEKLRFYTYTHTHTRMKLYIRRAVIPVLCTGRPYFLFTLNCLFQSLCLALLSYWFWNLLPFLFYFPTRCTI